MSEGATVHESRKLRREEQNLAQQSSPEGVLCVSLCCSRTVAEASVPVEASGALAAELVPLLRAADGVGVAAVASSETGVFFGLPSWSKHTFTDNLRTLLEHKGMLHDFLWDNWSL